MDDELISVGEAARRLGRHRGSLHRLIDRLGLDRQMLKTEESRGQTTAHISGKDFKLLQEHVGSSDDTDDAGDSGGPGWFYIIQLEPELDPNRLKLGFAGDVSERTRSHRTSAPFATVLRRWPCKLLWEKTAIECLTHDSEQIYTEVFRVDDVNETVERAERFFAIMPSL